MQFLYSEDAGCKQLVLTGELHKYLFKVRRFELGKILSFRNMKDEMRYEYKIEEIDKKSATLIMIESYHDSKKAERELHILWCIIDTKVIEKTIPMLNQIGVSQITFLYCDRSQKNFKVDLIRLEKILINSCQQSGRSDLMRLEVLASMDEVMERYSDFAVMDFGGEVKVDGVKSIMIGCEGGFSQNEREKLTKCQKIGINSPFILKSETAALTFASKCLI
jgi:16S rRNA (uracil1498-N3)-methyltransferase